MKKEPTIYLPVSVEDELPNDEKNYFTFRHKGGTNNELVYPQMTFFYKDENRFSSGTSHWLKPLSDVYVLDAESLKKIIEDAWKAGESRGNDYVPGWGYDDNSNNCEDYINNLNIE